MKKLWQKLWKLLLENKIFFPYKVRTFMPAKSNCLINSIEMSKELGVLIWLVNNLTPKSYCMKVKTVNIDEKWGNNVTILFKDPRDAVQYKMWLI